MLWPGSLEILTGPMFSGKTGALISAALRTGPSALLLKPSTDHRHVSTELVSHSGERLGGASFAFATEPLRFASDAPLVAIDEVQLL
jgi:thymidine kinase